MTSNVNLDYKFIIEDCLNSIQNTGGNVYDASVIEGHFGQIGEWLTKVVVKIRRGVATIEDVLVIKRHLAMYPY